MQEMKLSGEFFRDPTKYFLINQIEYLTRRETLYHFVGKDTVQTVVMQRDHPVEALQLIGPHHPADDFLRHQQHETNQQNELLTTG